MNPRADSLLTIQPMPRSRRYIVLRDIIIAGHLVDTGFQTDGASIPRWVWWLVGSPFAADVIRASVLHDWFYKRHVVDRSTADGLLFEVMVEDGVATWRAFTIFAAVRVCGGLFW